MDHSRAIYLSDLGQCRPAAAISLDHRPHHWQAVPYEAEGVSGTLLFAGPETEAPPVTLPLQVSGWHAVFLGLWSNWTPSVLKVKLTGDPAFVRMAREEPNDYAVIDERFWKHADLTGQDIVFAQQSAGDSQPAYVAYVKLVPLSEDEIRAVQAEQARPDTKRLICMNDGFSDFCSFRPTTREEIREWIEPYRDTDFRTLFWCIRSGHVVNYPSKIGRLLGSNATDFPRVGDRIAAESLQILAGKGIDTLRTVVDFAHSMGIQVHASHRMEAMQLSPPFDEFFTTEFYSNHPEWRCHDVDGREIARMSYAFPEVQELVLSILREVATHYDVDGVNPIFNRGAPYLLYEQPLVEGFRQKTGLDPRQLDEHDERYLRYRAGIMTDFMRSLRRQMDGIGNRRGRRLEISAHVLHDAPTNLFYGLDVAAWVQDGLIDNLIAYPWRSEGIDVEYFGRLTRGTSMKYYPEVMPRRMSPEEYRQRAIQYYTAGADGLCFWDTNLRDQYKKEWSMIRRLGHRDELAGWTDGQGDLFRSVKLRSVGGYVIDKYPPQWAY